MQKGQQRPHRSDSKSKLCNLKYERNLAKMDKNRKILNQRYEVKKLKPLRDQHKKIKLTNYGSTCDFRLLLQQQETKKAQLFKNFTDEINQRCEKIQCGDQVPDYFDLNDWTVNILLPGVCKMSVVFILFLVSSFWFF